MGDENEISTIPFFTQQQVSEKTFRHMLLESINNYFRDPENLENLEIMVINESLVEK